jgi:glycosyltransferase involved in cell wall biosynthesis
MACGTPCIASDDPALLEVSGGAALHFPRGDAAALRLLLLRVLRDRELREELSRRGLERAKAFRWDQCAALHVEVYREAAR